MIPKFRAWDKYHEIMVKIISMDFESKIAYVERKDGDRYDIHFDNLVFIKSTGLKDKNGVEIFFGNALTNGKTRRIVIWRKEDSQIQLSVDDDNYDSRIKLTQQLIDTFDLTVCGNIYENPELMEGE